MNSAQLSFFSLPLKACRDTFRFGGRSTRTEMLFLLIWAGLIGMAGVALAGQLGLPIDHQHPLDATPAQVSLALALNAAPFLPMVAMLSRRAHDFGWQGWPCALLGSVGIVLSVWRDLREWEPHFYPAVAEYVRVPTLLAFYIILLAPPLRGPNRYGPDPRGPSAAPPDNAATKPL